MAKPLQIPFLHLRPRPEVRKELDKAYRRVMSSGNYIGGIEVSQLCGDFIRWMGHDGFCIPVGNGFDALRFAMLDHSAGYGEIVVPSNAPLPVWMAVSAAGFKPIPAEPSLKTQNLTMESVFSVLSEDTLGVILVHMFGNPVSCTLELKQELMKRRITLIEDCSQAHGAYVYREEKRMERVGSYGLSSAFSFYPTKNWGAYGDAGMLYTRDRHFAVALRPIGNYGGGGIVGYNSRLDPLQAAFLRVRLRFLEDDTKARIENAENYRYLLAPLADQDDAPIRLPDDSRGHVYHQFVIQEGTERRNELKRYLEKRGIETMVHYPKPPDRMAVYHGEYPVQRSAYLLSKNNLSLPIGVHMTEEKIEYVAKNIMEFYDDD